MKSSFSFLSRAMAVAVLTALLARPQSNVFAAASLTVTPITWNVIGLDSNNVNVGPNHFPVGARVCNTGDAIATNVKSAFTWDTSDPYINLRPGTLSAYTSNGINLNPSACTDFYYEVEVTRNSSAYNHTRNYHISVTADGGLRRITPVPRELFVEHLVSQSRNTVSDVKLDGVSIPSGGTMSLVVGNTYTIQLVGSTATNGYEQIESFINFPNTIFQVLSVLTTYSAESSAAMTPPYDKLYGDACVWENDLNSPNYRACTGVGKAGGNITVTYQVRILQAPSAPLVNPEPLSTLIYDFSGSSYHYNADYGVSTRYAYIMDPSAITISKNFSPDPTTANGISTLTFTLTNPTSVSVSGLNFTDTFPTSPGAMVVGNPTNASTSGCGSPTFAPTVGAASLSFSNGTIAANGTCTIKVNVTVPVIGTYNNLTSNLFINSLDTGNNASDSLTVNSAPAGPAPVCGLTMAQWTFAGFTANPPPFPSANTQASNVTTAAISVGNSLIAEADTTSGGGNPQPGLRTYGWQKDPPIVTASSAYLQFAIDTSQYTQVNLQFDAQRKANGPNNDELYFSTNGTTWTSKSTFTSTTTWTTFGAYDFTGQTSTTGVTYFRIYGYGANATSSGNDFNLDNVNFTGCATPVPPTITKSFSPDPIAVNGISTLTFTLSNSNSIALTGVTFTDTLPTGLQAAATPSASNTCGGSPTWAPSAGATSLTFGSPMGGTIPANSSCTVSVNITGTASGPYQNVSGFISSTNGGTNTGSTGSATASLTVLKPPSIAKLFSPNPILINGTSTLTFTVTNPNLNNALTGVAFSDTYPAGVTNTNPLTTTNSCGGTINATAGLGSIDLSGGAVSSGSTCTVTINVTSTSTGSYANTSGAVSSTNAGTGNMASDTLVVNSPKPGIALLKQISTGATGPWTSYLTVTPGTNVYYQFTIENTGDVPLSPVSVTDPTVSAAGCTWPASLPAAVSGNDNHIATCVVGPISATSGSHINTATASGTYGGTPYTSTSSSARYSTPAITLVKSVTQTSFTLVGDVLNYSYLVTNSGFAPLLGPVTVTDDKTTVSCPAVSTVGDIDNYFDPGESVTCAATYTITLADLTAASVTNTASASAGGVTSNTDFETVYRSIADLIVVKANNAGGTVALGNSFNWTITVNNTGVAAATFSGGNVILTDSLPGIAGYYPQGALTVTNGAIVPIGTIDCSISGTDLSCMASGLLVTLPVGGSFSTTFVVTPATAGSLANTVTVDPNGLVLELNEINNTATDTVIVAGPPSISKSFAPDPVNVGGTSTLTFTLSNSNTATSLMGVGFTDSLPAGLQVASPPTASTSSCGAPTFTPSASDTSLTFSGGTVAASGTCTVTVNVTATTSGLKNNTTGNVTSTNGGTGNTANDTLTVNNPSLNIVKEVGTAAGGPWNDTSVTVNVGDTVFYRIRVANTGDITLTNLVVDDGMAGCTLTRGTDLTGDNDNIFEAGEEWTYSCSVTALIGTNNNTATADSDETPQDSDDASYTGNSVAAPGLNVTKDGTLDMTIVSPAGRADAGDVINYTVGVENTGNVALTGVTVSDPMLGNLDCDGTTGAPFTTSGLTINVGATLTCTGSYSLLQADLDSNGGGDGDIDNTATADSNETGPDTDPNEETFTQNPSLNVVKEVATVAGGPWNDTSVTLTVGDPVYYRVRVANTGNTTLTNLTVDDGMAGCTLARGSDITGDNDNVFEVGEEWQYTCSVTAVVGTNNNTATSDTNETPQDTDDASYTANAIPAPELNVVKDGVLDMTIVAPNGRADAGDVINYTISVQNTGNITLTGVTVSDPLLGDLDCDGTPGAPFTTTGLTINVASTLTCTGTYTLTQNDLDTNGGGDGDIDNTASADSNETGPDLAPNEELLPLAPAIDVTKTLNGATFNSPNIVRLTYAITVQNTGNVTLSNVQVTDDLVTAFPGAASFNVVNLTSADFSINASFNGTTDQNLLTGTDSLAVGSSGTISLIVDVDTGGDEDTYINMAVGSGESPDGSLVQDNGVAGAPGFVDPALSKTASPLQASVGDTITFTITVTNQGNVAAPDVVVTDALPAMFDVTAVNVTGAPLGTLVNVVPAIGVGPAPYTVTVTIGGAGGLLGVTDVVTIQIVTTVNSLGNPPIVNNAGLTTSAATNNLLNDNDSVAITLGIGPISALSLPATGFAPGRITTLAAQPKDSQYATTDVVLEIPRLGVEMLIVGVPFKDRGWDVSWLGNQAGWLEGSAFPSWSGNSVLTGHVYSASGLPGPFLNLGTLKFGDKVIVRTNGQKYIFEIRSNTVVAPDDSTAFKHEELSWLTLITCKEYDPASNTYRKRVVIRAVLISVE